MSKWREEFLEGWRDAAHLHSLTWRLMPGCLGASALLTPPWPFHPALMVLGSFLLMGWTVILLMRFPWREWWGRLWR